MSEVISHLVGIAITGTMVVLLKKKAAAEPDLKIGGISVHVFIKLGYAGILIMGILMALVLMH